MRKKLFTFFFALVASVSSTFAHDAKIDGIYYNFDSSTQTASVTYRGDHYNSYFNEYPGSVTIPETVTYNGTTYSVTSIGLGAFLSCSLPSVTIPNSVTSIGAGAFFDCLGLTSVTIPNSVTSIGNQAFQECSNLTSMTIPNNVTSIGDNAFLKCSSLTSVTIGENVTNIGDDAFYGCSRLTSIVWNAKNCDDFSSSSEAPFYYIRSQITSFTFGENVQYIPSYLCYMMSKLTSITIPNSVTTIGNFAFRFCEGLTAINCLADVPPILSGTACFSVPGDIPVYVPCGKVATYNATSVWSSFSNIQEPLAEYSISVYSNNETMGYANVDKNSICGTQISAEPNYGYYFVKWSDGNTDNPRTLELTQETILTAEFVQVYSGQCGNNLYWSYDNNTLTITGFGDMWDERPWGLFAAETKTIVFPDGITSIEDNAFDGFINLTSITIPNSVTGIGSGAFYGCSGLTSIVWNAKNCDDFSFDSGASFYNIRSQITSFTFGENVQHIPGYLCNEMSKLTSVTIPNSVTSIGDKAFFGCSGLTSIVWNAKNCDDFSFDSGAPFYNIRSQITSFTFGENVQHIPGYLCNEMSKLTSITIPNSVTSIGDKAFFGCSGLTSPVYNAHCFVYMPSSYEGVYVIPEGIKQIEGYAFYNCSGLTSVTLPNSVTLIEDSAFEGCSGLTSITVPNSVTGIGSGAFKGCSSLTSVTLSNSVTLIEDSAFEGCSGLTSITVPNSVTGIGSGAFKGCSSLTSVTLSNSVTLIEYSAFEGCSGLSSITIPNSVTGIEARAFEGCLGLTSIVWNTKNWNDDYSNPFDNICSQITSFTFGENVQYIPAYLCYKMSKLTSITIPNSVTTIGVGAFQYCSGLTSVTIGNGVATIEDRAFGGCSSLTSVTIGNSVKTIRESAFASCSSLTSITIPNSVTNIQYGAFANCNSLEKVSLGYGMEYISGEAFAGCNRLYDIYCYATNPPEAKESSFANYNVNLYVPCESEEDYEYDSFWGKFKFIECIDVESAVDDIPTATTNVQKLFRNGQLIIIRDGVEYNVIGQEM